MYALSPDTDIQKPQSGINYQERYEDYKKFLLGLRLKNPELAEKIRMFWNGTIFPHSSYSTTRAMASQEDSDDDIDVALDALTFKPQPSPDFNVSYIFLLITFT